MILCGGTCLPHQNPGHTLPKQQSISQLYISLYDLVYKHKEYINICNMLHVLNSLIHGHRQQFNSHPQSQDSGPQALLQTLVPLVGLACVWACLLLRWPCLNKFQQATTQPGQKLIGITVKRPLILILYIVCTPYTSFSCNLAALSPPAGKGLPVILNHRWHYIGSSKHFNHWLY